MSEFHPNRVRPPRPRFTLRRLINYWPLLVWIAILALTFWAYNKGVEFKRINGLVDPIQEAIKPDEDGRLREIFVKRGQEVKVGDVVARMDTTVLEQQIVKLEAGIVSDLEDRLLSAQFDLSRLKSVRRDLFRDQKSDVGELNGLGALLKAIDDIVKARGNTVADNAAFAEARARLVGDVGALQGRTGVYDTQLAELDGEIAVLEKGVERLKAGLEDDPEKLAAANGDLAELQELRVLRDRCTLTASQDGVVDRIEKEVGEFILKGETILRIVATPEIVRAILPQDQLHQVKLDQAVWVSSTADKYHYYESKIISLSPRVSNIPDSSSPLPNRVVHGQEVIVEFPVVSGFRPGQTVFVHFEEPGKMPLITKIFGSGTPAP